MKGQDLRWLPGRSAGVYLQPRVRLSLRSGATAVAPWPSCRHKASSSHSELTSHLLSLFFSSSHIKLYGDEDCCRARISFSTIEFNLTDFEFGVWILVRGALLCSSKLSEVSLNQFGFLNNLFALCDHQIFATTVFRCDMLLLLYLRKIFPFELIHLGGDEVNTDCWTNTTQVIKWLEIHNITGQDAYQYFVLRAQVIAPLKNWSPVNWEETFNAFPTKLHPRTVVHNWLGGGVCRKAVAKGFRCIFSNQGVWYLDHLDVPWDVVYTAEPLEGIHKASEQNLLLGGEVCMWGEKADTSDVVQTKWPLAAAAGERLWSRRDSTSGGNINITALPRLQYFRCLLNKLTSL
ncbi:hypothetical protein RIF29_38262 [Crotalaria pallida]|uniref:beta-N-acetylhexosaminidase n=1 Tax=Crotalaria pallida TaxID=3830 RepID=A0AAN9HLD0_CROPI